MLMSIGRLLFALSLTCLVISGCANGAEDPATETPPSSETVTDTSPSDDVAEADLPTRTFEEGFLEGCEGNQIAYQKWTDDSEAYATLVFASGRTEYTDKYHHLIPLIDRNLDIVFYDHIGQGRSDGIRAHLNSVDDEFACDLRSVVHTLAEPSRPVFLLSHSMGGLAAIRALQLEPDLFAAAAFSAPMWAIHFPEGFTSESAREFSELMISNGMAEEPMATDDDTISSCEDAKLTHDCDLYDAFKDDPLTHIGSSTWGASMAFLNGWDAMHADLDKVTAPIHVLSSGDDSYVDSKSHKLVCDGINLIHPERCSLETYASDWHELLNEVDRALYLESVLSFFDKQLP